MREPGASRYNPPMSDVTRILYAIEDGDAKATGDLLPLVDDASEWCQRAELVDED